MKLAFLDYSGWNYIYDTPLREPMGGSESALCYLSDNLGLDGHDVTVFNGIAAADRYHFTNYRHYSETYQVGRLNEFDAVIVLNRAEGRDLRERLGVTVPLILWTQHDVDQLAVKPLIGRREVGCWSAFAYVSDWQRQRYESYFQIPHDRGHVLRNAASPAFIEAEKTDPWFLTGKPPVLFYTSTPYRGLDVLLKAFPAIREATAATLKVFSSMAVYKAPEAGFQALYDQAKAMDGVEYIGSVGQLELAKQLSGAAALAYPSCFPETSCIAAIEAMALGCHVITTNLGALPETCGGWQYDVGFTPDRELLAKSFADLTIEVMEKQKHSNYEPGPRYGDTLPDERRRRYVHANYTWPLRAKEWEAWLSSLIAPKAEAAE